MNANKIIVVLLALLSWGVAAGSAFADEPGLADKQQQVAERYRRLEELLLRLADVEAEENAERAALLRRAAKQSRDLFVLDRLNTASQSLRSQQFKNALDSQNSAKEGLERMLTLLLSEDRPQRIRDEKERVGKMIQELKLVERLQKSTRARTENGMALEAISEEQKQIGDRAEKVREALREDAAGDLEDEAEAGEPAGDAAQNAEDTPTSPSETGKPPTAAEREPGKMQPGKMQPGEQPTEATPGVAAGGDQRSEEPSESEASEDNAQPADSTAGESQPGSPPADQPKTDQPLGDQPQPNSPQEGEPAESSTPDNAPSEPSESAQPSQPGPNSPGQPGQPSQQSSGQSPQQPQSPEQQAQQQLQEAIKKMRQAEQELEQSQREGAVEQQQQAEENLRAAIDRLEKILRQLREEEMQRELARLESRLRKMAQMQSKVLDETKRLEAIPVSQRDRQVDVKAGNLAFEEKKIIMEADRALLLLREEGSSVAFPEVVVQIRDDMQRVAERLTASRLDAVTIGLQDDILAALEEMIAALQKAQRDLEQQRQQEQQQGQPQPGQQQGEQPLVEQIAELRLIRTMETRIMATTERYARMVEQSADVGDVLPLIRDLAERQSNLYRVTRDIVQKRNQ